MIKCPDFTKPHVLPIQSKKEELFMKTRKHFTLIELLVSTVISSWHFFAQKSAIATQQRSPLFLKKGVGFGERGTFARKGPPLPKVFTFPTIFAYAWKEPPWAVRKGGFEL